MAACQDPQVAITAPKVEAALLTTAVVGAVALGVLDPDQASDVAQVLTDSLESVDLFTGFTGLPELAAGFAAVAAVAKERLRGSY